MPFCPKCGKELSAEASFCPSCGRSLREVDRDLRREKMTETRHEEMGGLGLSVGGIVIFLIGIFLLFITEEKYEWRGLKLYETTYRPYGVLAILLIVLGLAIALIGAIVGVYYSNQREKLMKQLEATK